MVDSLFAQYADVGPGDYYKLRESLRSGGHGSVESVYVHATLAVPPGPGEDFSPYKQTAKAAPEFHGKPWFSDVAITSGQGPWYGRLLLLLRTSLKDELHDGLAFIRYYEVDGTDADVGVSTLRWQTSAGRYSMEPISSITKVVHVVEARSRPGRFYLNSYLF